MNIGKESVVEHAESPEEAPNVESSAYVPPRHTEVPDNFASNAEADADAVTSPPSSDQNGLELRLIPDQPVEDSANDKLGYARYANVLAAMIQDPLTRLPLTIGINAPWGAGKSSLANMISEELTTERSNRWEQPYIVCKFNAWAHEDAASLSGPFIATVAKAADESRSFWNRLFSPLPYRYRSTRWKRWSNTIWAVAGICAAMLGAWYLDEHPRLLVEIQRWIPLGWTGTSAKSVGGYGGIGVTALARTLYEKIVVSGRKSVGALISSPESSAQDATLDDAKDALSALIKQATHHWPNASARNPVARAVSRFVARHPWTAKVVGKSAHDSMVMLDKASLSERRFVIIVDDIERVEPPRGISILEVINQLLNEAPVVTLLLGDMRMIGAAAGMKYEKLSQALQRSDDPQYGRARQLTFGNKYLQKIVQVQFDLPPTVHVSAGGSDRSIDRELLEFEPVKEPHRSLTQIRSEFERVSLHNSSNATLKKGRSRLAVWRTLIFILSLACIISTIGAIGTGIVLLHSDDSKLKLVEFFAGWLAASGVSLYGTAKSFTQLAAARRNLNVLVLNDAADTLGLAGKSAERFRVAMSGKSPDVKNIQDKFNDSLLIKKARARALANLSWSPRAVKRIENALKVYCVIADENHLFKNGLAEEHLGKWIGLRERWPRLAQEGMIRKEWFKQIESTPLATSTGSGASTMGQYAIDEVLEGVETTDEQRNELASYLDAEPCIGDVLETIFCLPYVPAEDTAPAMAVMSLA
jgi:hypothetical protein